jgi:hypothetical protein
VERIDSVVVLPGAEQSHDFAGPHREAQVVEREARAVALRNLDRLEHRC